MKKDNKKWTGAGGISSRDDIVKISSLNIIELESHCQF